MANYDPYDRGYSSRRYVREERDPRYLDARDYTTKVYSSRELVPRAREDSDLSVEEIRRDFPPPNGRDIRRARSAEAGYYDDDDYYYRRSHVSRYDRDHDYDRRPRHSPGNSYYGEEEHHRKKKSMSKQEKIIAAVAGAALLAGGKELYDRHEAKEDDHPVDRNPLSTVALAGVGAFAAYQGVEFYNKQQQKKDMKSTYILHRGRDGHIAEYYSDEDEGPKEKKGNKNFLESALAATGLGAAVKSFTGGGDSESRGRRSSRGSRSGSRSPTGAEKIQKIAMASLITGATEAFRVAKEPGGWKGEKAKRVLTAAATAATVDGIHGDKHGKLGLAESVIGGLVGNRIINGSRKDIEEDSATGRSRSRSRARSGSQGGKSGPGLAALATAGLGALGVKKAIDSSRSRSRGRGADSRSPSRRSRSRSVVDKARDGLAKLGFGSGDDARRREQDDFEDRGSRRPHRRYSDDGYDDYGYGRARGYYDDEDRSYRGSRRDRSRSRRSSPGSESDLGDSDEDEKRARKMKGKQLLTNGLAAVATIHAAHEVYQSMEKRNARQKAVREGRLSPAEAKKLKTKALMQDAASVGIAALGIKGAVSEMKEAKEMSNECRTFLQEKERRHEKREQRRRGLSRGGDSSHRRADSWAPGSRAPSYDSGYEDRYDDRYDDRYGGYESDDEYGPRYADGNPYGAARLPPPPIGSRGR